MTAGKSKAVFLAGTVPLEWAKWQVKVRGGLGRASQETGILYARLSRIINGWINASVYEKKALENYFSKPMPHYLDLDLDADWESDSGPPGKKRTSKRRQEK